MPSVVCPLCKEPLDVPPEFAGRPVRCGACQTVFTVPADRPPDDDLPGGPPVSRPTAPDYPAPARRLADDYPDDPPRDPWADPPRRPQRTGSRAWLWVTAFAALSCCGLGCGGLVVFSLWMVFPEFKPFDDPGGKYHAEFPGNLSQYTQTEPGKPIKTCVEGRRSFPPETYFVHHTDLPKGGPAPDPDKVLKEAADKAVADVAGGAEASRTPTTFAGRPAVQVVIDHPDDAVTVVRFLLDDRRLYAVGVTGLSLNDQDDPRVQGFFDRFKLKGK
ncbi:MAG: hypothetical protein U0871_07395 [Gemmataceae bacterium]